MPVHSHRHASLTEVLLYPLATFAPSSHTSVVAGAHTGVGAAASPPTPPPSGLPSGVLGLFGSTSVVSSAGAGAGGSACGMICAGRAFVAARLSMLLWTTGRIE